MKKIKSTNKKTKKGKVIKAYSKVTSPKATDTGRDLARKAMKPGKRRSKTGKIYYETRGNRADSNPKEGLSGGGVIEILFTK